MQPALVDVPTPADEPVSGKWYHQPAKPAFNLPSIGWWRLLLRRRARGMSV